MLFGAAGKHNEAGRDQRDPEEIRQMKTIMFWSYKGGSGRSVAAANVAAALAKLGKRVAVIDLDFDAPGLHHVFSADQTPQFKKGKGIQHYLLGETDLDVLDAEVMINLFAD